MLSDFRFNLAVTPVTRENYDQVWLFGFSTQPSVTKADDINPELGLNDDENMVLIDFMNSGGGLFAAGDHSRIGYGVGGRLPRVRHMRNWESTRMGSEAILGRWERDPATQQIVRLTGADDRRDTISNPGLDGNYSFNDQGDETAQRIFPRYTVKMINYGTVTTPAYQTGKWVAKPHVLLRNRLGMGVRDATALGFANGNTDWSYAYAYSRDISFLPDHAHEGECFELSNDGPDEIWRKPIPTRTYTSFGFNFQEFGPASDPIPADMVALSVAGGRAIAVGVTDANGFWKPPVTPRVFGAVAAFDGHVCPKYLAVTGLQNLRRPGRVVCDSTWHHFVNVNLNGEGSNRDPGLYLRNPATGTLIPSTALNHIYQYYKNTLLWLQPFEYAACLLTLGFADFRKNAVLMHELSDHAAFATVDDVRVGGRLLIEFFDTLGGAICADELAKSLLVSAERWNEFSALRDIRHNDAAPVESGAILEFAFGRALAAHFKRTPDRARSTPQSARNRARRIPSQKPRWSRRSRTAARKVSQRLLPMPQAGQPR